MIIQRICVYLALICVISGCSESPTKIDGHIIERVKISHKGEILEDYLDLRAPSSYELISLGVQKGSDRKYAEMIDERIRVIGELKVSLPQCDEYVVLNISEKYILSPVSDSFLLSAKCRSAEYMRLDLSGIRFTDRSKRLLLDFDEVKFYPADLEADDDDVYLYFRLKPKPGFFY